MQSSTIILLFSVSILVLVSDNKLEAYPVEAAVPYCTLGQIVTLLISLIQNQGVGVVNNGAIVGGSQIVEQNVNQQQTVIDNNSQVVNGGAPIINPGGSIQPVGGAASGGAAAGGSETTQTDGLLNLNLSNDEIPILSR